MKITCNRRDDILKRKAAYENYKADKDARYEKEYGEYKKAIYDLEDRVSAQVRELLGEVSIDLEIRCSQPFGHYYEVRVSSEDNNVHGKDKALSWTWTVSLDKEGEVKKESSSWSGLQATTKTQLNSLRETLRVLEILNDIDWEVILTKANLEYPAWEDYITPEDKENAPKEENFDFQLWEEDIKDAMESGKLVAGEKFGDRVSTYYLILKETPKQYQVAKIPTYMMDSYKNNGKEVKDLVAQYSKYPERLSKDLLYRMTGHKVETLEAV